MVMDDRVQGTIVVAKERVVLEDWVCRTNDEDVFGESSRRTYREVTAMFYSIKKSFQTSSSDEDPFT
jgi:hypothetical protein